MVEKLAMKNFKSNLFSATALILIQLLICDAVYAGWWSKMRSAMEDEIYFEIKVVDENGKSISGAALWSTELDDHNYSGMDLAINRLFERYFSDYDYARPLSLMMSRMTVQYFDSKGEIDWGYKTNRAPKLIFGVLKRGYFPVSVIAQSKQNHKQKLVITLKKNVNERVDPRMELFDSLRGDIFNSSKLGIMTEDRFHYIQEKQQKMREIASELEVDQPELAARVYLNLADLPKVLHFNNPDGSLVIKGFSNGLDMNEVDRVIDFEKGLSLDSIAPELQAKKIIHEENKDKIRQEPKEKKIQLMQVGLRKVNDIVQKYPERVWPNTYIWLVYRYKAVHDYSGACSALRSARNFEFASETEEIWADLMNQINRASSKLGLPLCTFES